MSSGGQSVLQAKVHVSFPNDLTPVRFVHRLNRFTVEVKPRQPNTDGSDSTERNKEDAEVSTLLLHLPNSGRMQELLTPGASGLAVLDGGGKRKTAGTLLLVCYQGRWVSVDARMPNRLFEEGLKVGAWEKFCDLEAWRAEVPWGNGRIDFMLTAPGAPDFLVETKSCNLVEDGLALFPDAPTQRGARHLKELTEAVKSGLRAAVVWFVQRDDADRFSAHRKADPAFADALDEAMAAGVEAYAYRCQVSPLGVRVIDSIPIVRHDLPCES